MQLQLIEKKQISPDLVTFYFKPEAQIDWKPGQFLRYHIDNPNPDDRGGNRFFSISSAPFEDSIQLTTRFAGDKGSTFKKDLQRLEVGGTVEAFGPSGHFVNEDPSLELVLIAGGIGITPFRAILLDLDHQGIQIKATLIYANRTKEAIFKDELEALALKHPGLKIYYIVSDEHVTQQQLSQNVSIIPGKVDEALIKKLVPDFLKPIYYISGPEPMVLSLEKVVWDMGVPKENTKRDYFPGYAEY